MGSKKVRWTKEEVETLKWYHDKGYPPMQISKKMGKSYASVRNKIIRTFDDRCVDINSDKLLSPYISQITGCSERSVMRWIHSKELPSKKRGEWYYVKHEDLVEFLQKHPDKWVAMRADESFLGRYDFYLEKLAREKAGEKTYNSHLDYKLWDAQQISTCCRMIAQGYTAREIGETLGKSKTAIDKYIAKYKLRQKENNKWIGRV